MSHRIRLSTALVPTNARTLSPQQAEILSSLDVQQTYLGRQVDKLTKAYVASIQYYYQTNPQEALAYLSDYVKQAGEVLKEV
jgi:hypothetical protein